MEYLLVQYACNKCGKLTPVLDCDEKLPNGWVIVNKFVHYCPKCAKSESSLIEELNAEDID